MSILIDFLKGIVIGISNVIPGFSGGTMAVILKVYERFIDGIEGFIRHPLKTIKDIWALFIGMIVGVIISSYTIVYALESFPLQTVLFFGGLVAGSIPMIYDNMKKYKEDGKKFIGPAEIISFLCLGFLVVILPFINKGSAVSDFNFITFLMVFLMGIVSAATMIVPGISGSLVLMIFGYYILIIDNIKEALSGLLHLNFSGAGLSLLVLFVFGMGCLIGGISIAKLIKYLFEKFPKAVFSGIMGLLVASIFSIVYKTVLDYNELINFSSPYLYVACFVLFALGLAVSLFMYFYDKKGKGRVNKNENI